jgi:hypothetical protein
MKTADEWIKWAEQTCIHWDNSAPALLPMLAQKCAEFEQKYTELEQQCAKPVGYVFEWHFIEAIPNLREAAWILQCGRWEVAIIQQRSDKISWRCDNLPFGRGCGLIAEMLKDGVGIGTVWRERDGSLDDFKKLVEEETLDQLRCLEMRD